ncbi:RNA polymerase subunit sigma-70 [Sphingobacteriaceae bacterium]|nr:RNA polymerase subunit sigma-70 [Sphingobacteriaceae bacterium]
MVTETKKAQTNEEIFVHAYKTAFPKVSLFVKKMGGNFDEAKDIFQDALVIYYEKTRTQPFEQEHSSAHYITGIARHLWYKKYRDSKSTKSLSSIADLKTEEEEDPKVSKNLLQFVEVSGKKCMELLKAFYYEKLNMKDLSLQFGFSGERSATTQKYKCLEKVRNAIKEKSLNKEDFYD